MKVVEGNLLNAFDEGIPVIAHQVNCKGKMGAGLARQIKSNHPKAFRHYKKRCDVRGSDNLGRCQLVEVRTGRYIANLFGQDNYGGNAQQTVYRKLGEALGGLNYQCHKQGIEKVALPYGIGCGLAGGDWGVVEEIIKAKLTDVNVVLYKYDG